MTQGVEIALHTSRAETASGNSQRFPDLREYTDAIFVLDVTAASGTTPTLAVVIETYDPVSGTWDTIVTFTVQTGVATEWKHALDTGKKLGNIIRARWTIGGTTPSFTFSVGAVLKG